MVQMLSRPLKPLGRPKQPRPTPKLNNTTVRDFGGGLNVVDSEQNLTSRFSPIFDNMVTYTDRRAGPRFGYEMWLKLKQGQERSGSASGTVRTALDSNVLTFKQTAHGYASGDHLELSGFTDVPGISGIPAAEVNRVHSIRRVIDADNFEIVVMSTADVTGVSGVLNWNYKYDNHALGGVPIECTYFANYILLWTSTGEILRIDRFKVVERIWDQRIAFVVDPSLPGWTQTEFVAHDIFGKELICSNGHDKPLTIDFNRTVPNNNLVQYALDLIDGAYTNAFIPAFDACKSSFRYFTVHDTDAQEYPDHQTEIRVSARDTFMVFQGTTNPQDSTDIDMSKIAASPEQTVRGFATIKDTILVISPTTTTMLKYGQYTTDEAHDPIPIDTLNGFGTNAPRTIVEIGSDVFMVDFNGVPSAKLSTISNAVIPERVSNYIETMMARHIGRLRKETMRLHAFGFYDGKNRAVHFYLPKFDEQNSYTMTDDPFYFDLDMAQSEDTKQTLILRYDAHLLEVDDQIDISGATGFSTITADNINGRRRVVSVLSENYLLVSIGQDLPASEPITTMVTGGGGNNVNIKPVNDGTVGYIYHYVPQLKLTAWSRFKTRPRQKTPTVQEWLRFNCGCSTLEGRCFLFTPDGYVMRYGSADSPVYADWYKMYDYPSWMSGKSYVKGDRVYDSHTDLVFLCLEDVTTSAPTFEDARLAEPDSWEEYRGEPIDFAWELPWSDFGQRQNTKALRFIHLDANGLAEFTVETFADNIYKDAATGKLMPARSITFVPNEAGAYGAGQQVYGAGRRTREQRLWQVPVKCKILKLRLTGQTTQSLSISAISMLYQKGSVVRG